MLYLRVKKEYDQRRPCRQKPANFLIGNELITPSEWKKQYPGVNPERYTTPVEISKQKTYCFFGARLADTEPALTQ